MCSFIALEIECMGAGAIVVAVGLEVLDGSVNILQTVVIYLYLECRVSEIYAVTAQIETPRSNSVLKASCGTKLRAPGPG